MGLSHEEVPHESFGSGNIARVLKQARASLKDPSRPFTPRERRLRCTKSLFGEAEFRPIKTRTRCDTTSRYDNVSKRKGSSPNQAGRLHQAATSFTKGRRRQNASSTSLPGGASVGLELGKASKRRNAASVVGGLDGIPRRAAAWGSGERNTMCGIRPIENTPSSETKLNEEAHPPLSTLGELPVQSADFGSSSDSEDQQGRGSCLSERTRRSSALTNRGSAGESAQVDLPGGKGEYEGLYDSNDDFDTSAWDLGSVDDGTSEGEAETSKASPCISGDDSSTEYVLDAIDNEIDLGGKTLGSDDNSSETDLDNISAEGSDHSPDPGALEGQRERNMRLAGLLHMLSRYLDSARGTQAAKSGEGGRCRGGGGHEHSDSKSEESSGGNFEAMENRDTTSSFETQTRARDVLLRVMERPRGSADASPPSIAELPGILAARLVMGLVLPSLLAACNGKAEDRTERETGYLMKVCRHFFEVSKKAQADDAFFSSGAVACLLEFVGLASSDLHSFLAADRAHTGTHGSAGKCGRSGCGDENHHSGRRCTRRGSGNGSASSSSSGGGGGGDSSGRSGSNDSSTNSDSRSKCSRSTSSNSVHKISNCTERNAHISDRHVGSICDALTFAVGCLRNVSVSEGLQHKLVQAGAVSTLCRLVRSTRDLCRRRDGRNRPTVRRPPIYTQLASPEQDTTEVSDALFDSCEETVDRIGGRPSKKQRSGLLRRRVSPPLAQAISLLRALAVGKDRHKVFRAAGAVGALCSILRPFRRQQDVVLNAARALARLSLQGEMRGDINSDSAHMQDLLAALVEQGKALRGDFSGFEESDRDRRTSPAVAAERRRRWEKEGKRVAACVRIAFALGNLTSANDGNRTLIGLRFGGAESLPALLQSSSRAHLSAWKYLRAVENTFATDVAGVAEKSDPWGGNGSILGESWSRATLRSACDGLEEMLVKTVRLLANISINRDVGQRVCRHPGLVALEPLLGKCLEVFGLFEDGTLPHVSRLQSGRRRGRDWSSTVAVEKVIPGEELMLNIVSLVTNLSFYGPGAKYQTPTGYSCSGCAVRSSEGGPGNRACVECVAAAPPYLHTLFSLASRPRRHAGEESLPTYSTNAIRHASAGAGGNSSGGAADDTRPTAGREVLCGHLVKVLLHPNAEAVAEAARAFGNFSRDPSCREAMVQRRADEVLVALLGHSCREVVFAAAGALVNLAADPPRKALLSRDGVGAGERLARLVRRAGLADPGMAELACQALHNLLIEPLPIGGAEQVLGGAETHRNLWWTLRELIEACSCEGQVDSGAGSDGLGGGQLNDFGGFPAAAAAVFKAMNDGSVDCGHISLCEELWERENQQK